jgi:cytochrome c oxidase assembly protein subunit 15
MSEGRLAPSGEAAKALAVSLGIAVGMWSVGFLGRLPGAALPAPVFLAALLAVPLVAGIRVGRSPGSGVGTGFLAGIFASAINLLVLAGVLVDEHVAPVSAGAAIAGSFAAVAGVAAVGAAIGARRTARAELDATSAMAKNATAATIFLVMLGGLVTSWDAGLAVVDWPNSYGYPMFLFPAGRMVGGVFYEHAHRLYGTLVGLVTLLLAVRLLAVERRVGVRALGLVAVVFVIGQGILGGLRVTGHFTWSTSTEVTRPSLALAMVHGATGQIFCALMAALAAVTSRSWRLAASPTGDRAQASTDRILSAIVVGALLLQLLLGIRLRHLGEGVMIHITFAVAVLLLCMFAAVRAAAKHEHVRMVRKSGRSLLVHAVSQVVLGGLAFMAVQRAKEGGPGAFDVAMTTAHQTTGAALLANAVLLALWCRKLLPAPAPPESRGAS